MSYITNLKCRECGQEYPISPLHVCETCFGPLEVTYDYARIRAAISRSIIEKRPHNLWRYRELLPVDFNENDVVGPNSGFTPLLHCKRLGAELGLKHLYIKDDTVNHPTLSYKDRVVSVSITKAREFGFTTVSCASTGNLATAVAAHAARAGLQCYIFMPEGVEAGKVVGSTIYGAKVITIRGNYDDVNRLCTELSGERDWAFVNVNMRPYYAEGSKTLAYEIAEQLGWELPDRCVVPIASGSLYTKVAKGFEEWLALGLVEGELPVMNGAQAQGCSPVATAWEGGHDVCRPVKPDTIAKSLAIGNPADGPYAIDAVTDDEIRAGIRLLAETTGVFTETAGGTTTATLAKLAARGDIDPSERVVLVITGEGLKTLDAVRGTFQSHEIGASFDEFVEQVEGAGVRA
jgi:threonine synthase